MKNLVHIQKIVRNEPLFPSNVFFAPRLSFIQMHQSIVCYYCNEVFSLSPSSSLPLRYGLSLLFRRCCWLTSTTLSGLKEKRISRLSQHLTATVKKENQ